MSVDTIAKDLNKVIRSAKNKETGSYDTQATVVRIEEDTAWVHIAGGVDETPVQRTIACQEGDRVQVRVGGGRAWITGNASAPPTDDAVATQAKSAAVVAQDTATGAMDAASIAENNANRAYAAAERAEDYAEEAKTTTDEINAYAETAGKTVTQILNDGETAGTAAQEAKASAENASEYAARALGNLSTVQSVTETLAWITQHGTMTLTSDTALDPTHVYFVVDSNGDYTVGGTKYAVVTEPDVADIGTYYELSIDESLNNYVATHLAVDKEGLWILPDAGGNKVLIATGRGSTYRSAGTYIVNGTTTLASFDSNGVHLFNSSNTEIASFLSNGISLGENSYNKFLLNILQNGIFIKTQDYGPGGLQDYIIMHLANYFTLGIENKESYATRGKYSLALGKPLTIGTSSFQHGTFASGNNAFAQGKGAIASGESSSAQGGYYINPSTDLPVCTEASGSYSRAQGSGAIASGDNSLAQGEGAIATKASQVAIGNYNVEDTETISNKQKAFIIGNGENTGIAINRSNAFTVDWSGNAEASGNITAENAYLELDDTATSGTDYEIIQALTDLGWDSECIG